MMPHTGSSALQTSLIFILHRATILANMHLPGDAGRHLRLYILQGALSKVDTPMLPVCHAIYFLDAGPTVA